MTAPEIRYRPGTMRAVVSPLGVAVLPGTIDAVLLDRVWHDLDSGLGLAAVLESLTGAFGTSLRLIPPFAVVALDGAGTDVRIAVRGDLTIEAVESTGTEPVTVSGADVTTWSERVLRAPQSLTLRAAQAPDTPEEFSIASGVVLASALTLSFAPAAPSASAEPAEPAASTAQNLLPSPAASAEPAASTAQEVHLPREDGAESGHSTPEAHPEETISAPEETLAATPEDAPAPSTAHDVQLPREDGAGSEHSTEVELDGEVPEATVGELPDDAYDHLWGATVVKSVETAAVREVEEDDESPEPAAQPVVAPTPAPEPVEPPQAPAPEPSAWTAPPPTGLIDSVPGFGNLGTPAPAAPAAPVAEQRRPLAPPASYAADAATSTPTSDATPASDAPTTGSADDHDGLTVTVSELEAMRRLHAASDEGDGPGHGPATTAEEPVALGRIVLSTGENHVLDRPVIIGRRPRANRVQGDRMPLLITVDSPEQDISRNHLEVRLEGRHVLVADMHTTNGSVLHREGTPPLRLSPDEAVLVLTDDLVDLGDGVTVRFEEIP
ncbi:hypothetical protein ACFJGV_14740 [Cnuibacter sp. UC19_7]|uniref:hypothetical protein n=1 Tax=Cnuibacter sp. UC19_7 TaxID=3350166 RepID=UPI0036719141